MKAIVLLIFLVLCVISTVNAGCTTGGKGCPPHKTCIKNSCVDAPKRPRPRPNKRPCAGKQQGCPQPRT